METNFFFKYRVRIRLGYANILFNFYSSGMLQKNMAFFIHGRLTSYFKSHFLLSWVGEFTGVSRMRSVAPLARLQLLLLMFHCPLVVLCCLSGFPTSLLQLLLGFALPVVLVDRRLYCWGNRFCLTARPDLHGFWVFRPFRCFGFLDHLGVWD